MNIFTKSPQQKIADFSNSAINAIAVFTKTLTDLASINSKIDTEREIAVAKMAELDTFEKTLATQKIANEKIMGKIKTIIED